MNTTMVARPTVDPTDTNALHIAIEQHRQRVLKAQQLVLEARDLVARAGAELDVAVRERSRAIFEWQRLNDQLENLALVK